MRVMLVTNGLGYGGAERIVEATAHALVEAGHDTHVVATTRGGPIRDALRERGVAVSVLHIASRFDLRVPAKLAKVARRFRPDVMHTHLAVADIAGAIAKPFVGSRLITTVHNPGVEIDPFKRTIWRNALRAFDRIHVVSEAVRRSLPRLGHRPVVTPVSLVDPDAPLRGPGQARAELGLEPDRPVVLGVGRLARVKGFDVLVDAAARIEEDVQFAVIGNGPERDELEGRGVRFLGARADAAQLMVAADIVVCPSRSEGFPQVPLQAMAACRAVVATSVGGMPEVVEDGLTGDLVRPEDPDALADALRRALRDPARTRALGERGRRRLIERGLTRDAMMRRTFDAYRELMVQTGSRGWT